VYVSCRLTQYRDSPLQKTPITGPEVQVRSEGGWEREDVEIFALQQGGEERSVMGYQQGGEVRSAMGYSKVGR
jgi:hypothetical protein